MSHILERKQHPPGGDANQRIRPSNHGGQVFEHLAEEQLFEYEQHRVVQPPQDEIPACAVP